MIFQILHLVVRYDVARNDFLCDFTRFYTLKRRDRHRGQEADERDDNHDFNESECFIGVCLHDK